MHNSIRKRRRWLIALFIAAMLIAGLVIYFSVLVIDHPPQISDRSVMDIPRERVGENAFILGNNWLRKSESGLWEMYIEGEPFDRGVAFGKLTRELLQYQETVFVNQIQELVPSRFYLRFLKYFVAWFNRNLDEYITEEYKEEIYGTSLSCSPDFDFIGSGYQRQLNYHAAHDIGHALQGLNMVGCTSFSVWDKKSKDSTLIIARNFDFYAGRRFDDNKIVCFYNPVNGYKFMMITWADMIGVVSGMNEKGLTVTINASKSSIPTQAFTPVTLLAREILQYAATIDHASEIAERRKLFVSESILVGSALDGKTAIIEKSPEKYDIVWPSDDEIICSNHFQGKTFANEKANIENINGSDSYYRYRRVEELLAQDSIVDVRDAVSILRNRKGLKDADVGTGNPMALNQLIAHHSVVFEPEKLLVWVSAPPYQLGNFIGYDLNKVFSTSREHIRKNLEICSPELTIPADTFLFSKEFRSYQRFLVMSEELKRYKKSRTPLPDYFENNYLKTNPRFYLGYVNLGNYFEHVKNYPRAHAYYQVALSKSIPGNDIRTELTEKAQKLLNK